MVESWVWGEDTLVPHLLGGETQTGSLVGSSIELSDINEGEIYYGQNFSGKFRLQEMNLNYDNSP